MSDQSKPPTTARRILLGQIASAHGIRGEILVRTFTGDPAAIATYGPLSDKSGTRSFRLKIVRVTDKGVIARVEGVADRTAAEPLKGTELYVERSKLPPPADDEFYHADLVGLGVELEDGTAYGIVRAVVNFGAGDLVEVSRAGLPSSELIPFTKANVPTIDFSVGRITIVPPVMVGEPEPQQDQAASADDPLIDRG